MNKFLRLGLATILSGILLALAMPPVGISWLAWIALAPVFAAAVGSGLAPGFLAGVLTALITAAVMANVPALSHLKMAGDPTWIYGGYLLFGAMFGIVCAALGETKKLSWRGLAFLAAGATLLEYGSAVILPMNLGISQDRSPAMLSLATFVGLYGVSSLVWLTNGLFSIALIERSKKTLIIAAAIAAISCIPTFRRDSDSEGGTQASIIQTNSVDLPDLMRLTKDDRFTNIAVWPELSGGSGVIQGDAKELRALSRTINTAFVTTFEDSGSKPHNVAAAFWKGQESEHYWKRHPFAGEAASHTAGTQAVAANLGTKFGLNICFDSCYAATMLETARLTGVQFIALPTLDPPTSNGVIQALHAAYTPFRAAELGMPILRADTTADSMIVDYNGRILVEGGTGESAMSASINPPRGTFYRFAGDHIWQLCLVVCVWLLVLKLRKKEPAEDNSSAGSEATN